MSTLMRCLLAGLWLVSSLACAETYKWVGPDGKTHISNTPPPAGDKNRSSVKVYEDPPAPSPASSSVDEKLQEQRNRLKEMQMKREAAERQEEEARERAEKQRQACENAWEEVKKEQAKPVRERCCGAPTEFDYAAYNKRVNAAKNKAEAICSGRPPTDDAAAPQAPRGSEK